MKGTGAGDGCVATPTGRLRKGKPAKAASKRISAPGSQQVSHAWLLSLTNKPVSSGSTSSRVAGYLVRRQRQGRDTACCHEEAARSGLPTTGRGRQTVLPGGHALAPRCSGVRARPTGPECMAEGLRGRPQCSTPQGLEERRKKASPHWLYLQTPLLSGEMVCTPPVSRHKVMHHRQLKQSPRMMEGRQHSMAPATRKK